MRKLIKNILLFAFLFLLFNWIFVWFYEMPERRAIRDKTDDKYLKWEAIHNSKNKFDVIFLGSSRGYCAYNPQVFDSVLHVNSYNMCTGLQNSIESYYYLKEILHFQKPKVVVYDMFLPSFEQTTDYYQVLSNAKLMTFQGEKDMILNGFGAEGVLNYCFPFAKYAIDVKENTKRLFSKKDSAADQRKWIKGYLFDTKEVSADEIQNFPPIYSFSNTDVSNEKLQYFDALAKLCRANGVALFCVTAPFPPSRLKISNDNSAHLYFKKVCEKNKAPFYDLNYIKGMDYQDSDFTDFHHMNAKGASKATNQLAALMASFWSHP